MNNRYTASPIETASMSAEALRSHFLINTLFVPQTIQWTYSHFDRILIGGAFPIETPLPLTSLAALKTTDFLERRELGIINVGGTGLIKVNGHTYQLEKQDCLYIGKGTQNISFSSLTTQNPAKYYLLSAPAHAYFPTTFMGKQEASPMIIGSKETANERTIYKYIHQGGIPSCQLVMGVTSLFTGSVWNTMPAHVHDRRTEIYFYFDLPTDQRVLHLMGEPQQTRHLWVSNEQAIISPPWSIHSGCGTSNYSFIWGMAGENDDYTDMDAVPISSML